VSAIVSMYSLGFGFDFSIQGILFWILMMMQTWAMIFLMLFFNLLNSNSSFALRFGTNLIITSETFVVQSNDCQIVLKS
jgi:hypothetical protein